MVGAAGPDIAALFSDSKENLVPEPPRQQGPSMDTGPHVDSVVILLRSHFDAPDDGFQHPQKSEELSGLVFSFGFEKYALTDITRSPITCKQTCAS